MELDIRYVAGLFDGEGWITVSVLPITSLGSNNRYAREHIRYQLFVGISMTHYPIIEALHKQFGGMFTRCSTAKRVNPNHRITYTWRVASRKAGHFLPLIAPHLVVKREEAEIAMEFQRHIQENTGKMKYKPEMRPELYAYRQDVVERLRTLKKRAYDVIPVRSDPILQAAN